MKQTRIRWHIVLMTVLAIIMLPTVSIMSSCFGLYHSKTTRCQMMLGRLSLLIRDRKEICNALKIDEKGVDDAVCNDPATGIALYCRRVSPELFRISGGRKDKRVRIIDVWGKPIKVQIRRKNGNGESAAPYFRFGDNWIRVWSVGPNGIDECGGGDDIVMDGRYIGAESFALMPVEAVSMFGLQSGGNDDGGGQATVETNEIME